MLDQSLLLYSRRYLTRNHLLGPQPITLCRLSPIDPITDIRDPFTFSSSDDLDHHPSRYIDGSEKLILEHETAMYLSSIIISPDEGKDLLLEDLRWSIKIRIEEPLVKEQRRRHVHNVCTEKFEHLPLGTSGDLGILWDSDVKEKVSQFVRGVEVERMVIGTEVLGFLQGIHRPETQPSTMDVVGKEARYCKPESSQFLTPPLLPSSPVILPSLLKLAETLDLRPINAGETTSLINDLVAPFMAADSVLAEPSSEYPLSFLQMNSPTSSPIRKRARPETLMVEALLTPPTSTVKKIRFADLDLPPRISTPAHETEDQLDGKMLVRVSQELAQEQLQEADSTLRVETPFVDLSIPKLPWENPGNGLEKLSDLKGWAGTAARNWGGSAGVGIDLSWRPFSKSTIKVPIEDLGGEEYVNEIMVVPSDDDGNERVLMDEPRALGLEMHGEDQEIELEPGVFTVKIDMEALLKRKKKRKGPEVEDRTDTAVTGGDESKTRNNPMAEVSLSSNSLDTFIALRSRTSKRPKTNPALVSRAVKIGLEPEQTPKVITTANLNIISETQISPTPKIQLPASPGTFIASTTLLAERHLFRLIKDLYPVANIIERDFSVPIIDNFAGITSNKNDSAEADLILSSFSGIVITSLQKIRQAPMPGQALSTIRHRIMSVSLLYERLFVIVLGNIHESDIGTIAGFAGFTAGLRAGVHIRVLKEGDEIVARWIVALMIKEGREVRLLEDETLWERFLRKAGFNAFAAQVVLRSCKEGGLRAFLKMCASDKRELFRGVVGERVMGRVLARLEGEWEI